MFGVNEREAARKSSMEGNLEEFCLKGFLYLVTLIFNLKMPQETYFFPQKYVYSEMPLLVLV